VVGVGRGRFGCSVETERLTDVVDLVDQARGVDDDSRGRYRRAIGNSGRGRPGSLVASMLVVNRLVIGLFAEAPCCDGDIYFDPWS